ncbi:MAG: adenylyltransferase/cytidyltransferase family protein [Promethearchaeota archaeon]
MEKNNGSDEIDDYIRELKDLFPADENNYNVMIAGTFDLIHTGHIYLMQQAARIGRVHVIVARDKSVFKFKHQYPIMPEKQRLEVIRAIKYIYWAQLGADSDNWTKRILEINPHLFLLGPNQYGEPSDYEKKIHKLGGRTIFRRLKKLDESFELNSSTKIKIKILNNFKVG